MGLDTEDLVGGACDDTNFCTAAGITVEALGTTEVVGAPLGMDSACTFKAVLLPGGGILGGGIVVIIDIVVDGTALLTTFWEAVEIGVELDKGCLSGTGGVLAMAATDDSGKEELLLLNENGAFCIPMLGGVKIDCGFDNAGNGGLLAASKLGRLPPLENGGRDLSRTVFLSKEKLLP